MCSQSLLKLNGVVRDGGDVTSLPDPQGSNPLGPPGPYRPAYLRVCKRSSCDLAYCYPDPLRNILERLVPAPPTRHGLPILGQGLEFSETRPMPVHGTEDDRNHASHTLFVTLEGSFHLHVMAIVRGQERGADKQQDDLGRF